MANAAPSPATSSALHGNQIAGLGHELRSVYGRREEVRSAESGGDKTLGPEVEGDDDALWLMQERLARADLLPWPSVRGNQDFAVEHHTPEMKEPSEQLSDSWLSSLSLSSASQASPSRTSSPVSSIEMDDRDIDSDETATHSHRDKHLDALDDSLGLEESDSSTIIRAFAVNAIRSGGDDAYSLSSSVSSISSLSSTSSRSQPRTPLANAVGDHIENIPRPLAQEHENDGLADLRFWHVDEYVTPKVLSSLSSASELDLGAESGDDDGWDSDTLQEAQEVGHSNMPTGVDAVGRSSLPQVELPSKHDAYIGFYELRNVLLDLFPHRDAMILDVGCGTSSVCEQLALHGFSNIHGVDLSASVIGFQQQQTAEIRAFVQFHQMNAAEMSFPALIFDGVITKAVLDRLASAEGDAADSELLRVLREIVRCLRPGGLWISVSCHDAPIDVEPTTASWWGWTRVKQLVADGFVHVKMYRCGTPFMCRGELVRPFAILILRRRESPRQQLERWAAVTYKTRHLRRQMEVRDKWRRDEQRQREDLRVVERELPAMLCEDHRSILANARATYERRRHERAKRRAALHVASVVRERMDMEEEDMLAEYARIVAALVAHFVRDVILECADAALSSSDIAAKEMVDCASNTCKEGTTTMPRAMSCNEKVLYDSDDDGTGSASQDLAITEEIDATRLASSTLGVCMPTSAPDEARHLAAGVAHDIVEAAIDCAIASHVTIPNITSDSVESVSADHSATADANAPRIITTSTYPRSIEASDRQRSAPTGEEYVTEASVLAAASDAQSHFGGVFSSTKEPSERELASVGQIGTLQTPTIDTATSAHLEDDTSVTELYLLELVDRVVLGFDGVCLPETQLMADGEIGADSDQENELSLHHDTLPAATMSEPLETPIAPGCADKTVIDVTCQEALASMLDRVCLEGV